MRALFAKFLLPALLFAVGIYFLLRAPGPLPILSYFVSAVFLGMGIAALQRGWRPPDGD